MIANGINRATPRDLQRGMHASLIHARDHVADCISSVCRSRRTAVIHPVSPQSPALILSVLLFDARRNAEVRGIHYPHGDRYIAFAWWSHNTFGNSIVAARMYVSVCFASPLATCAADELFPDKQLPILENVRIWGGQKLSGLIFIIRCNILYIAFGECHQFSINST